MNAIGLFLWDTQARTEYRGTTKERSMHWVFDRVEGSMAVCTNDAGQKRDISVDSLPFGLKEGDVLIEKNGCFLRDEVETARRRREINDLVKGMWA